MKLLLNELIVKKGISQTKLAKDLGFTTVIVNQWCNNKRLPSWNNLDKIASYLNVDVKKLLK